MEQRPLGNTGLAVSHLGLGTATFGREIDQDEAFRVMDYAVEHGVTLFDTAEGYGGGQAKEYRRKYLGVDDQREVSHEMHSSEKIIGRWLASRNCRKDIVLMTKVSTDHTRDHVRQALAASLERLKTDFADVYFYHSYDAGTPMEEAVTAMNEVVKSGHVRVGGCSNYSGQQLTAAIEFAERNGMAQFGALENSYSLAAREIETDAMPVCRQRGVGVVAYSPLGAGFLAGKYTPDRNALPKGTRFDVIPGHMDVYFSETNFTVVKQLHAMAERVNVPPLRLAMGWVIQNPNVATVLVGARHPGHIDNALEAKSMEFPAHWMTEMNAFGQS
ncbi:MAG: aldo/keto reductase [Bryobacteraceae bacterium]